MSRLRWAVVLFAVADGILTLGYFLEWPWAIATWPWPDLQSLDYLLVSSFLAGATAVILWLGLVGDWGAAAGATLNVGLMNVGASAYLFQLHARDPNGGFLRRAITFGLFAAVNATVFLWSLRHPIRDRRPAGKLLWGSFVVFTAVLLFAAVQLFRGSPTIFPWRIEPEVEVMVGWLFLGSAVYFGWGVLRPSWHNARGQLIAFLAYDLVLFPRYVLMFSTVNPEHLPSLIAYVVVLTYSSLLAAYYLFINPRTRSWRMVESSVQSLRVELREPKVS